MPIRAESLGTPGTRTFLQALETFVGQASRLRKAASEAQVALDGLRDELIEGRRQEWAAQETVRRLGNDLAQAEALLAQLESQRRDVVRVASPPPRTVPTRAASPRQVVGPPHELTRRVAVLREDLAQADRRAGDAGHVASAKAAEVARQAETVDRLRKELAELPTEPAVAAALAAALGGDGADGPPPTAFAVADIPEGYLGLYRRAAITCPGLSWTVLAAIGSVESSHGRAASPGVRSGANEAGAMGPMQFLAETWSGHGTDGDGDGDIDVYDAADAVFGAAHLLCASGAGSPATLAEALWAYNHADWYVASVLSRAAAYGTAALGPAAADLASLLNHPNLTLTPAARADLLAGRADPRLVAVIAAAAAGHRIELTVIQSGHAQFVRGTDRVSNHYDGRAVDIFSVDGQPVSASNHAALRLALALLTADPSLRPDEVGSPWPDLAHLPGAFSDADHADHLHIGWDAKAPG